MCYGGWKAIVKKKKEINVAFLNNTMQFVTHLNLKRRNKIKSLSKNENKAFAEKLSISNRTFLALNLHSQMNARQL